MLINELITEAQEDRINRHDPVRAGVSLGTILKKHGTVIAFVVTTGASSVKIFDQNAPFKFEVVDVLIQPRGDSTSGTMQIASGGNVITDAMTCATDKTLARPTTIDDLYSTVEKGQSLEVICAGTVVASTIGLVLITIVPKE